MFPMSEEGPWLEGLLTLLELTLFMVVYGHASCGQQCGHD